MFKDHASTSSLRKVQKGVNSGSRVAQQSCSSNQQSEILEISPRFPQDVQTEDKAGRDPLPPPSVPESS